MNETVWISGTAALKGEKGIHLASEGVIIAFPEGTQRVPQTRMHSRNASKRTYKRPLTLSSILHFAKEKVGQIPVFSDLQFYGIEGQPLFEDLSHSSLFLAGSLYGVVAFCAIFFAL